jgi:DNA-binding NtrC family response regulator
LIADVKATRFREDLFYRLHVFPITVPPLRERPADIPALARHFLARFAAEEGKRIRAITPEALRVLAAFRWPGNIRQLENAVFRAVVLAEGDTLGLAEFPQIAAQMKADASGAPAPEISAAPAADWTEPPLVPADSHDEAPSAGVLPAPHGADMLELLDAAGDVRPLEELETELIRFAIDHYRGQMSEVARRLKIGRSTLYRKLDALGLNSEAAERHSSDPPDGVAAERQDTKIS